MLGSGIDQWLIMNKTCPFCKHPIDAKDDKEEDKGKAGHDVFHVELDLEETETEGRSE